MSLYRVTISFLLVVAVSRAPSQERAQDVPVGARKVFRGFEDKRIPVLKPRNKLQTRTQRIDCVAISPGSKYILAGEQDRGISVWSWATGELRIVKNSHDTLVKALVFTTDDKAVVSVSITANRDNTETITKMPSLPIGMSRVGRNSEPILSSKRVRTGRCAPNGCGIGSYLVPAFVWPALRSRGQVNPTT
jgi:WD40 repeat protein